MCVGGKGVGVQVPDMPLQGQMGMPQPRCPGLLRPGAFGSQVHRFSGNDCGAAAYCPHSRRPRQKKQ